jgi:alkylation response protein AidB-like acyl-CoA dehydrogenase
MTDEFAEVRDELRAVARDLLGNADRAGRPDREAGVDWRQLADAGWLGLDVPAALDGAGATFAEVAVIAEELGRAAAPGPYLGAVVLGVGTLRLLESGPARDDLLRSAVSGSTIPAAAVTPGAGDTAADDQPLPFRLVRSAGGLRLHGSAAFVPDVAEADRLLLLALDPDGVPVVVATEPGAPGLRVTAQPVLDTTRRLGLVAADDVAMPEASLLRFAGDSWAAVRQLLDRAAVALACDSLGLSEAMLDATVGYARLREQFGRPIGSFQAVKHACADMLVQVCVARQLVCAAVTQLARDEPGAGVAAAMAKSYACGSAVAVTGKAMQLHGGIGYTWESGIHVYLKRATLNRSLFGSPTAHRKRLAARYRPDHQDACAGLSTPSP